MTLTWRGRIMVADKDARRRKSAAGEPDGIEPPGASSPADTTSSCRDCSTPLTGWKPGILCASCFRVERDKRAAANEKRWAS